VSIRRIALWLAVSGSALAQLSPADLAYDALRAKDYDRAIAGFRQALAIAPENAAVRKDLAYTLLKVGETEAARDQFAEVLRLNPGDASQDDRVALEYAYLCYETGQQALARRTFDRLRKSGNADAAEAFENVDRPLREGIARWQAALAIDPDNFSAQEELAKLAMLRDDSALAAEHYERAWHLKTDRRDLLLELGRAWAAMDQTNMDRTGDATAAWIAAWRGGTPRVSEQALALLPERYPYLAEFERALALDPGNLQLQRDVAFQKGEPAPASHPLGSPPGLQTRTDDAHAANDSNGSNDAKGANDAKSMGLRSFEKGYMADALKYLELAKEADPGDYEVMLKLGWTFNMLKDDETALHWFDLARHSPDPAIAEEAGKAYRNLAPSLERFRTTFWVYPIYSSRWQDLFGYAQVKTEMRLPHVPFLRPYLSVRFLGDVRGEVNAAFGPQYLSERSIIFAGGLATRAWHGLTGWFEAGEALIYYETPTQRRRFMPDYRGGFSYAKGFGNLLTKGSHGLFAETSMDGIFISRFDNDSLLYSQNRAGYTLRSAEKGGFQSQILWNANATADAQRQYWANYVETGPGVRFRFDNSPLLFSVSLLRGAYLFNEYNPRRPNYSEVRVGVWYAFTR
jgi:tetratricopeptide (TPR) repeat protein